MAEKLIVTQVKSGIGRTERQNRTLRALGLTRMHQTVTHPDNPAVRGMVNSICHLVKITEE